MAKKDIGKILTTGSARQRMLLIAEDIARSKYFVDKLLSEHEFNQLSNSFKKSNEIKLWNDFRKADDTVTNAIMNLQGLKFEVLMNYSNLRGYILVWNSIENAELLVNSVLHEIKDPKERKRIAEDGAKGVDILFSRTEPDQEGYIDIKIDFLKEYANWVDEDTGEKIRDENAHKHTNKKLVKEIKSPDHSLWNVMNNVKKEAETSAIKYLSWESAIVDYMDNKGFNVKTYKDQIKEMSRQIYSPIIGWAKYYGELNTGVSHPRLEDVVKKYSICPNVGELQVDEDQYNWFKKHILGDE
jgi:hypothetical protein